MADDLALKGAVIDAVSTVLDPASGRSILDAHILDGVEVSDAVASIRLQFPKGYDRDARWKVEDAVADAAEKIDGVREARVSGHVEGMEPPPAPAAQPAAAPKPAAGKPPPASASSAAGIPGVGRVIAVASGKGGVGKSTVAVNLALALHRLGFRTGLLDIDIYGPSVPTLLGVNERPDVKDRRIQPIEAQGLRLMSLGFLMEDDTPVIWRGPIVTGIIRQFLQDVDWEGTDYLVVDMPPGTGDAQLSLAQTVPVDGAIVVTTPSDLALLDAARGLRMFQTLNVDVLGIVENMSWYEWPGAAEVRAAVEQLRAKGGDAAAVARIEGALAAHGRVFLFGQDGGRREAERLGTPLLGQIPLDGDVRRGGDEGHPIVASAPESAVAAAFADVARRVVEARPVPQGSAPKKGLFSFFRS